MFFPFFLEYLISRFTSFLVCHGQKKYYRKRDDTERGEDKEGGKLAKAETENNRLGVKERTKAGRGKRR
jgi:hypothetical protein